MTETIRFNEVQRFKTKWAWLAVVALNIVFIYAIVQQVIIGKPFGSKSAPDYVLIIIESGLLLLLLFLFLLHFSLMLSGWGLLFLYCPN